MVYFETRNKSDQAQIVPTFRPAKWSSTDSLSNCVAFSGSALFLTAKTALRYASSYNKNQSWCNGQYVLLTFLH